MRIELKIILLLCISFFGQVANGQIIGDQIVKNGLELLGQPYVGGTLDVDEVENFIVHNDKFDCVTFVEYVIAETLSQTKENQTKNQLSFEDYLTQLRYNNGVIDGYASRNHYFTDWIYNAESRGLLKDITELIGGVPYRKTINFMTKNRQLYKKLKDDDVFNHILMIEEEINSRPLFYLPANEIAKHVDSFENGDIIAVTTSVHGLDVSHTGFIIFMDDKPHLLHASDLKGKVVISDEPIDQYISKSKKQTGIIISRMLEKFK